MGAGTTLGHHLLRLLVAPGRRRFEQHLGELESVQRARLNRWLSAAARSPEGQRRGVRADWSWEEYARQLPVTGWSDYAEAVQVQRERKQSLLIDSPVMRYQPTSGSTSAVKWVPYTKMFLDELDQVITAWVGDLYRQFPDQGKGTHYWSLSWIPTELRSQTAGDINDDMKMLSWGKRLLAYLTQAAPQEIALARSSDDSLFATIAYLAADEALGFISVWSPTFGLGLLEQMSAWRSELADVLSSGQWGPRHAQMAGVPCPRSMRAAALLRSWDGQLSPAFFEALWPSLAVLSAWDTAAATPWARKLQGCLPQAHFQGKGLWATEGVVTFPFQGRYPLAYLSHAFEFIDAQDGKVLAPWQLRQGQDVIPLLTTGSGLSRYQMSDVLRVDGALGQVPSLTFLGRNDGVDLVGEKTSATVAQQVQDGLTLQGALPVTLLALDEARHRSPGYVLLVECGEGTSAETQAAMQSDLASQVEKALQANFHYKLARELGQLQRAACVSLPHMRALYLDQCRERGMIEGNIKIEPLRHWRGNVPQVLRQVLDA
ncbi:MAG: GH3 auxin-responsive promoter family protein [Aquabacterium sp.]|uniref:GH3 family domain-containing protein n=1 Tax=Aquabacterium sp. TaxID=1872578 RepID=UPI001E1A8AEF|nr:GH3 auxin-responsive promoter family protein [Aquabacterium sp.]MBT9609048.1 GH3 auxin-responsive promoter family protein [Aquabacterium sp.]